MQNIAPALNIRSRGFALPVTTFFVVAFLAIPFLFWGVSSINSNDDVRGATVSSTLKNNKGLITQVYADSGTWDLLMYICKTKEECLQTPTSGKRVVAISGGKVSGRLVPLNYTSDWDGYSVAKIYVKSGWGFGSESYKVLNASDLIYGDLNVIKTVSQEYQVVLINVSDLANKVVGPVIFGDK